MRKSVLFVLFVVLSAGFAARAQDLERYSSGRLDDLANQLKRQTVDLVDRTDENLRRGGANSRRDIEAAFLARQLDSSAGLFDEMVRDRRRAGDLRDAASILSDLTRRAPGFGANSALWRNVQNAVNDINRELGNAGGGNSGGNTGSGGSAGSFFWRGMVDDVVQLEIRGRSLAVRTISGRTYPDGNFSFTSPLPTRGVNVEVEKKSGRGNIEVIQQPSRSNNFTTVVQISDRDGGAREYQLEIFWQ